jgi:hypothetical protein
MTKHFEANLPGTEFTFDPTRFADLQGALDVIDDSRRTDPLRNLRPTNPGVWMLRQGVDVSALAQRIEEVTEMQRDVRPDSRASIDLHDIENVVCSGLSIRRLNTALKSTLPTAELATALAHVEPLGWRCLTGRPSRDPMGWVNELGFVSGSAAEAHHA